MASAAPIATQSSDGSLATTSDGSVVKEAGMQPMTDEQWAALLRDGYVSLGTTASPEEVKALRSRVHDIMMGKVRYDDALLMQLDPSAPDSTPSTATTATTTTTADDTAAKDAAAAEYHKLGVESSGQTIGWKVCLLKGYVCVCARARLDSGALLWRVHQGPTVNYRKIGEAGNGLECDDLFMKFMQAWLCFSLASAARVITHTLVSDIVDTPYDRNPYSTMLASVPMVHTPPYLCTEPW